MNSKLVLLSTYVFITTKEQLRGFLNLYGKEPKNLEGLLVILDSKLISPRMQSSKASIAISYMFTQSRKLNLVLLVVTNPETKLDKRIVRQLDYTSQITSKEIEQKEVRL